MNPEKMNATEQAEFQQIVPDKQKIMDRAIEFRKENPRLIPGEALKRAFEEIGTTHLDHDQMYYQLLPRLKTEEKARAHKEKRKDLFD